MEQCFREILQVSGPYLGFQAQNAGTHGVGLIGNVKSLQGIFLAFFHFPDQWESQDIVAEGGRMPQTAHLDLGTDVTDGNGLGTIQMIFPETALDQLQEGTVLPVANQGKGREFFKGQGISRFPAGKVLVFAVVAAEKGTGTHHHQFFPSNQQFFQERIWRSVQSQYQIQLLGLQQLQMMDGIAQGNGNVDLGIGRMVSFQKTGQQEPGSGGTDPKTDFTDFSGLDFLDPLLQIFLQMLDLVQGADQGFPCICQLQTASPLEQFRPQLFFQLLDMFAETLLGNEGPSGCFGEIHLFCRQQEHFCASSMESPPFDWFYSTGKSLLYYIKLLVFICEQYGVY